MSILLEPVSVHSLPLHFHEIINGVQLPFTNEIGLLLPLILSESLLVVEEDGLVIGPQMLYLLLLIRGLDKGTLSLISYCLSTLRE